MPPPFLPHVGKPAMKWTDWYREFKIWAVSKDWDSWNQGRREALLLNCVGQEGRRLYFAHQSPVEDAEVKVDEQRDRVKDICAVFLSLFPEWKDTHSESQVQALFSAGAAVCGDLRSRASVVEYEV